MKSGFHINIDSIEAVLNPGKGPASGRSEAGFTSPNSPIIFPTKAVFFAAYSVLSRSAINTTTVSPPGRLLLADSNADSIRAISACASSSRFRAVPTSSKASNTSSYEAAPAIITGAGIPSNISKNLGCACITESAMIKSGFNAKTASKFGEYEVPTSATLIADAGCRAVDGLPAASPPMA